MAINGGIGFDVDIEPGDALACFSESASRVVMSVAPDRVDGLVAAAGAVGVSARVLGRSGGTRLVVDGAFSVDLEQATRAYRDAIPTIMGAVTV